MKRKLIIFPGNFLPHIGGLETHVDEFVKYLSKNDDYEITIFTPNITNSKEKEVIHSGVEVIRYPAIFLIANFPIPAFWKLSFWKIFKELYSKNFDIVMTRTMFFSNSTLGMFFAKFRIKKIKLIHVEHGSDYSKLDSFFKSLINKIYMKTFGNLLLILSDKIISVSNGSKEFLKKNFFVKNKNISVIRRGFNFKESENIKINIKIKEEYKNKLKLIHVGRLIEGKGVQDTLKALKEYKKENKNFIFLIIGDGNYKHRLEILTNKYNLDENVKFLGKKPHNEVISILKSSDIFITASHTEGLPTSVLDAFFSNIKIIATNVGGTYEILEKDWESINYSLIKPYSSFDILKSIELLSKNKFIFNEDLIIKIKNRFDWKMHVNKYIKVFEDIKNER